jgi:hypothetical protein
MVLAHSTRMSSRPRAASRRWSMSGCSSGRRAASRASPCRADERSWSLWTQVPVSNRRSTDVTQRKKGEGPGVVRGP